MGYFGYPLEEIKNQASIALGNLCTGNMALYFPKLLEIIQSRPEQKHLLLYSLRQVRTPISHTVLNIALDTILVFSI